MHLVTCMAPGFFYLPPVTLFCASRLLVMPLPVVFLAGAATKFAEGSVAFGASAAAVAGFVTRSSGSEAKTLALLATLDGIDEHVTAVGDDEVSRASHATFSRDFDAVAVFT
jgi:hypothetical protein